MLIPTPKNIKTVTDMREDAIGLLKEVERLGLIYLFQRSIPKAVVLSLKEFLYLKELIEDLEDERDAAQLAREPRGKGIPLEKVLAKYQNRV